MSCLIAVAITIQVFAVKMTIVVEKTVCNQISYKQQQLMLSIQLIIREEHAKYS